MRDRIRDRYHLEGVLGEGAYGRVHRAFDERLGRKVALKTLTASGGDPSARARFRREAEVIRGLMHPNTVRMFDFGEDDGLDYIVYELVEGSPLSKLVGEPFSDARTAKIAEQILGSLFEAHRQGIVHRDVKPANVLITQEGSTQDYVKLLDFGIAKLIAGGEREAGGTALTATGAILGSPRYMAPEQVRDGALIGPATDLYSVGLVMAEMLSGKPVVQLGGAQLLVALISEEPIALPDVVVRSRLGFVVRRALEKDPARRYASAGDMLEDLEKAMQSRGRLDPTFAETMSETVDDATLALPPSPRPPSPAGPKRRSGWALFILLGSMCFVIALVVVTRSCIAR